MKVLTNSVLFLFYFSGTHNLVMYGKISAGGSNNNNNSPDFDINDNGVDHSGMIQKHEAAGDSSGMPDNLTLYIVFGIAILVFIMVILIVVKVLKKKNANPNGYTLTSTGRRKDRFLLFEINVVLKYSKSQ